MKTLRRTCAATILSLTIVVSASAGDLHAPGAASPPPPTTTSVTTSVIVVIVSLIHG